MADGNCIDELVVNGVVPAAVAEPVKARWAKRTDELVKTQGLTASQARLQAARELGTEMKGVISRKQRLAMEQAVKQEGLLLRVTSVADNKKKQVANSILEFDVFSEFNGPSVQQRFEDLRGQASSAMLGFINQFRSKNAGLWKLNKDYTINDVRDLVAGLFNQYKGDNPNVKAWVEGIQKARQMLVDRFNAAGGNIRMRKDWGWVQSHDAAKIKDTDRTEWVQYVMDRVKREEMLNDEGVPLSDGELKQRLVAMWEDLSLSNPELNQHKFVSPVNNRAHSRDIIFKDATAWTEYAERFGEKDILNSVMHEMDRLAKDVSLLEIMGPYPRSSMSAIKKQLKGLEKRNFQNLFDQVTGATYIPLRESVAKWSGGYRSLSTASRLGSSIFISTTFDPVTAALTAGYNGLPQGQLLKNYTRLMTSQMARREAARVNFYSQTWLGDMAGLNRQMGEYMAFHAVAKVSDTAMRLTGTPHHTESLRNAYKMTALGYITEMVQNGKKWENLPKRLQAGMAKRGVTKGDWELYSATVAHKDPETGAEFIKPEDMYTKYQGEGRTQRMEAASRIGDWIAVEAKYAVVEPTQRSRAFLNQGTQPGSVPGEFLRHLALFRSFTVAYTQLHGARFITQTGFNKLKYGLAIAIPATLAGALTLQMAALASGKSPEDMETAQFWMKAMGRGGAFGPASDALSAMMVDSDQSVLATALGPTLGSDVWQAGEIGKDLRRVLLDSGKRKKAFGDLSTDTLKLIRGLTPGNTLWYTKLAMEREVWDQLQFLTDPMAVSKWKYTQKMAKKENGQNFYWQKGEFAPN